MFKKFCTSFTLFVTLFVPTFCFAQSISQYGETVTVLSPQLRRISYTTDWTYPPPSQQSTTYGMQNWFAIFWEFIYDAGGGNETYGTQQQVTLHQNTFNYQYQGTWSPIWDYNAVYTSNIYKPFYPSPIGVRWKAKVNSTVYYYNPQQFLNDNWTQSSWEYYYY